MPKTDKEFKRKIACEYAIYRGDTFLFCGTNKECADYLETTENAIRVYCSKFYAGKIRDDMNCIYVIKAKVKELEERSKL